MQVSGGHLLPPVQKLVATIIFAHRAKMQIKSTIPSLIPNRQPYQRKSTLFTFAVAEFGVLC